VNAPPFAVVNVVSPELVKALDKLITSADIDAVKSYLRWHLLKASVAYLPARFVQENFNFSAKMRGVQEQEPRWKRCVFAADRGLGEILGQAYVERVFGGAGKQRTLQLVHLIEQAMEANINALDWMTPETKKAALVKLHAVANKIGYPDKWRDYSTLKIDRNDALGNSFRITSFERHRLLNKIGKPVDKTEWAMTPPLVNAYYLAGENNINFPAGILQPPFFDKDGDDALNFGGIGTIIGHELIHGFDDQGAKFDAEGNLRNWWSQADQTEFKKRTDCIADQYSQFEPTPGVKLNGRLTVGENTADNGGTRLAYLALQSLMRGKTPQTLGGFTPEQRFFLGFAQIWCADERPEAARGQAIVNTHSPGRFRVNGVVQNMPEFGKAFSCKQGQPMVRENACRVW
jgi:endothelin-converting enzyme/putative endopeptidase